MDSAILRRSSNLDDSPSTGVKSSPYHQLGRVDRAHAETIVRSSHENVASGRTSRYLATRSLLQSVITSIPLVVADFCTLYVILYFTTACMESLFGLMSSLETQRNSLFASLLMLPIANLAGLYPAMGTSAAVEFRQLTRSAATALCIFAGIGILQNLQNWPFLILSTSLTILLALPLLPTSRFLVRALCRRCSCWGSPILIYAESASVGGELFERLNFSQERGLRPVTVLLDSEIYWATGQELEAKGIPCIPVEEALNSARESGATWVLMAKSEIVSSDHRRRRDDDIEVALRAIPNRVFLSPAGGLDCGMWDRTHTIGTSCGLLQANARNCTSTLFLKRCLDLSCSLLTGLILLPLLVAIALIIKLTSAGPILYGQSRVGRGNKRFTAWKFRSMVPNADKILQQFLRSNPAYQREWDETHKLRRDPRITWIGRVLRRTSLDELPQLWNVLRGEMSLVGPRPLIDLAAFDAVYIRDYPREFALYTSVRPGLTGMWQVSCRNNGVYEMRIYWDMYYIRNWSLWLDLYILLRTVRTVLLREGAA